MLNLSKKYSLFSNIKNAKKFDSELLRLPCGPGSSLKKIKKTISVNSYRWFVFFKIY
jgi:hypothetical protein